MSLTEGVIGSACEVANVLGSGFLGKLQADWQLWQKEYGVGFAPPDPRLFGPKHKKRGRLGRPLSFKTPSLANEA
jgi:hypothetical protein